jgi:hypothetical protein
MPQELFLKNVKLLVLDIFSKLIVLRIKFCGSVQKICVFISGKFVLNGKRPKFVKNIN